nr:MAG TPA: lytic transglycosylase [Caudoviricetes sp.]
MVLLGNTEGKPVKPYEEKTNKNLAIKEWNMWQYIGKFKITFYWLSENGKSTSTGAVATEGRTIAVDPNVIPYGTEVLIDGRVYIAEDCGGAVKGNVIDIFVEDERMDMYYTDVYVRKEK